MMGNAANVSRCASILAVEGSSGCTREIAAFTCCSVWNISTFQWKYRSISADPRLVMDCTVCNPGTLLTASSSGRVIVTIIWSIGITPLSTPTITRGKFVDGNTATGMVNARYAPSNRQRQNQEDDRPRVLRDPVLVLGPTFSEFTPSLRSDYFSLDPSLGAFDPSAVGFASSAGASAASILILVLSGNP